MGEIGRGQRLPVESSRFSVMVMENGERVTVVGSS